MKEQSQGRYPKHWPSSVIKSPGECLDPLLAAEFSFKKLTKRIKDTPRPSHILILPALDLESMSNHLFPRTLRNHASPGHTLLFRLGGAAPRWSCTDTPYKVLFPSPSLSSTGSPAAVIINPQCQQDPFFCVQIQPKSHDFSLKAHSDPQFLTMASLKTGRGARKSWSQFYTCPVLSFILVDVSILACPPKRGCLNLTHSNVLCFLSQCGGEQVTSGTNTQQQSLALKKSHIEYSFHMYYTRTGVHKLQKSPELGIVVHACNPSIQQAVVERCLVRGQCGLPCRTDCLKKQPQNKLGF